MEITVTLSKTSTEVTLEFHTDGVDYADSVVLDAIYPRMAGEWSLAYLNYYAENLYAKITDAMVSQGWDVDGDGYWVAPESVLELVY